PSERTLLLASPLSTLTLVKCGTAARGSSTRPNPPDVDAIQSRPCRSISNDVINSLSSPTVGNSVKRPFVKRATPPPLNPNHKSPFLSSAKADADFAERPSAAENIWNVSVPRLQRAKSNSP